MFFFFSSRRRHTRSLRDWSSDVCSSDLAGSTVAAVAVGILREVLLVVILGVVELRRRENLGGDRAIASGGQLLLVQVRSEERRVGKGSTSRSVPVGLNARIAKHV